MGFDMHQCTSWLVCSLLLGTLHITAAKQHAHLAAPSNLVQSKTLSSSSFGAKGFSKFLLRRNHEVPESFGFGQIKKSNLPLLAPPLNSKRVKYLRKRIQHIKTKPFIQVQLKNKHFDGRTWFEVWEDTPLSRHRREAPNLKASNNLSSAVGISVEKSSHHSDNAILSTHSLTFKPNETKAISPETEIHSNYGHSSINSSLASSTLVTASMTLFSFLSDLISSAQTPPSSVKLIDTSVPVSSFQPTKNASKILPTKIIPTPSVIPSSNTGLSPKLSEVDKQLNSIHSSTTSSAYFNFHSFPVLQPSMPSISNTDHQSVESTTQSLISLATSLAHVPTPALTKPFLTNLSTSPIHMSSVLNNKIPNFFDLSSTSLPGHNTNKIPSLLDDKLQSVSISSLNVLSIHNSLLPASTNPNENLTLGDQPTPQISAQTELSGIVPKSLALYHSKAAHMSKPLSAIPSLTLSSSVSFPHPSEISPSSTLRTTMATRPRINVTSTWYQPESAHMVSPLLSVPGSKNTSTVKSTTKPKTNTHTSVTQKPPSDGANNSVSQRKTDPEPESGSTTQSSNVSGPDSEYTGDLLAKPVPDWEIAKKEWKAAWEVHLYLFGILFAILAVYSLVSIVRLWHIQHLLSKKYFVVLNLLIFFFCLLRMLFLLIDGYNSNHTFLPVIEYFLVGTVLPCLTSSFSVLFYALLNATKVQMLPTQIQRLPVLICIILFHFLLSLSADILIAFFDNARILLFVCQIFFVLWGLFLFLGYIYAFRSLYSAAEKRQKSLLQLRQLNNQWESNGSPAKERLTLSLGIKVTLLSAILGTVCACLQAYAALGVFGVFSKETPQPWPWWGYQTSIRFIEFFFCVTMIYVATQPFKYHSKYDCGFWFYFSSCIQLCQIKSVWNTSNDPGWNELDDAITNTPITKNGGRKEIKAAGYEIIPLTITLSTDADLSMQDPLENESMLVVQDGFVRFRTNEELEQLRRSPRIPRMDLTDSKPTPSKPKTLQWGENSTRGHQNGGFQSGDTLPGHMSPDCISTSTSPSSSQWNRISTTGSELTFRPPSISLAESIDKELEQYFRRSSICSERSLYSVRSTSMPGGIAIDSSEMSDSNSVFPSEGSPCGNGPIDGDCLPDLDPTFSTKQGVRRGNVRDKLVNNVRYLSLDDLQKCPQNSSCGIRWKADSDT